VYYVYVDFTLEQNPRAYYVGKGLKARIKRKFRNHKHQRIADSLGFDRRIFLATEDERVAFDEEERLIRELKTHVDDDFGANYTYGGEGASGRSMNEETRRRISCSLSGHTVSDDARRKMSDGVRAWLSQPGSREKIVLARRSRDETPEERRKYTRKKLTLSDETKARIGDAQRGSCRSEETKRKMSKAARAAMTPELRELRSKALRGIVRSEETRAKLRAAWVRRKEKANERTVSRGSNEEIRGGVASDASASSSSNHQS
jgi:hypothetical protein